MSFYLELGDNGPITALKENSHQTQQHLKSLMRPIHPNLQGQAHVTSLHLSSLAHGAALNACEEASAWEQTLSLLEGALKCKIQLDAILCLAQSAKAEHTFLFSWVRESSPSYPGCCQS